MKDGHIGGVNMVEEMANKEHTGGKQNQKKVICPVCGKVLGEKNLPDYESVITEQLYFAADIQFINCEFLMRYTFEHYYDEEAQMPMEEPHTVKSVIRVRFDESGACTAFDILEVHPGKVVQ